MKRREFIRLLGGAAAAWPLAARAAQQQSHPARIGFLPLGSPSNSSDLSLVEAIKKGISESGLVEKRDVLLDVVWTQNGGDYPKEVIELIRRGAEILVTAGSSASSAAKHQTSTIPIVFVNVGNPIDWSKVLIVLAEMSPASPMQLRTCPANSLTSPEN